ncbi:STAS/SEC14 domain-containing protein [Hymenobacter sediminis]|uniref:STAS/SEC14 domain-containing protein n=1 Tax=Hymenobacter sediminis TaxID=2218621 RepID=UPI000DA67319|nr:STAS/SEC14 domain-containing protein [Hymenobacter sediminis]RPD44542.1 STAS/SEC14 domain-containing protein [Hymenobacter sediminis]
MKLLLFDSPLFTLYHNPRHEWLHIEWRGIHTQQSVEEYCGMMLEAVRTTKSRKMLNDASEILDGWANVSQWLGEKFLPQLAMAGIESMALLNAMDWPARLCVQTMMLHVTEPNVRLFEFDEAIAARQWLDAA